MNTTLSVFTAGRVLNPRESKPTGSLSMRTVVRS